MRQLSPAVALRPATDSDSDCDALSRIACAAKAHWGYPAEWLEEWRPQLTITPDTLREIRVVVADDGAAVLGFSGTLVAGAKASLEHLWIDPESMGRGVGRALYEEVLDAARSRGAELLEIESDPSAEPFYQKMGAVRVGTVERPVRGEHRELPLLRHHLK